MCVAFPSPEKGINIKHTCTVFHSLRVYFKPVIVPYPSHSVISTSGGSITRLFIETGVSLLAAEAARGGPEPPCVRSDAALCRQGAPAGRRGMQRRCYFGFNPSSWGPSCWDAAVSQDGETKAERGSERRVCIYRCNNKAPVCKIKGSPALRARCLSFLYIPSLIFIPSLSMLEGQNSLMCLASPCRCA